MGSSKKDFYTVNKLLADFINGLTEEQFSKLVDGLAEVKYVEKALDSLTRSKYDEILLATAKIKDRKHRIEELSSLNDLNTKAKLIDLCKYINIDCKSKDRVDDIIAKIENYVNESSETIIDKNEKSTGLEERLDEIGNELEKFMNVDEARHFLVTNKDVASKTNLVKLARKLRVYIEKEASYDLIIETILKSVVEAKIRSYTIRKKM